MTPGISFFASVPASEPQVRRATVTGVRLAWRAVPAVLAAALVASCSKPPEAMASDHVKRADAYVAEKKYRKALVEYRNALQRLPQSGEARYKLAQAYVLTNHPTSAYREYVRAPSSLDAQLKAGQMLLLAKHFEDARTRADKALGLDSRNVQALILRGASLAGLKDVDSAIAQPEEAVDPDRSGTYNDPGALHLAKGDAKSAETAFAKAVQVDPKSVTARLMLAVFYMSTRRAAEAEPTLKQALDIDGTNPKANCTLALLYLASNRGTEAEPYLKAYADAAKTAVSRLALADYYTSFDRPDDALPILDAILANDAPAYAAAQSRLAALEFMRGKKNEAHKRHDDLLTRQPKFTVGLVMKARFLLAEHQLDEALAQATAAAKEDPASAQRQFLLGRAYAATDQPDESERAFNDVLKLNPRAVAVYPHLARVQLSNGKPDLAVRSARQAINGGADHPDAHLLLARSLIACHELAAAEAELKALATRYPNVAAVHNQIAAWHLAKGHPVDAKRSFERALALDAKSIEALSGLVDLDLAAGKAADAQGKVGAALTRAPADARVLLMAGETYAALGDPDRAEAPLKRAIEIDPGSLRAYALLGHLFVATGKLESAKAEFEAFAERRPGTSAAIAGQTMVGLILETQNRLGDAQAVYEKILTVSPRAVVAANNLAWLYAERGANLHVALNLAQAVAQQVPDRPEIDDTLGRIYYKKELATLAIPAFRRSVEKDATNPLYHYHLGLTYTKTRDWTRAKQSLEKALGLSTNFDGATDARKVLASISG